MDNDFGLWEVIVSIFWFMLLFAWIWLLIMILSDLFRDRELGGGAKALWVIFIIFLWQIATNVVATRQALDYPSTGKAVVLTVYREEK